MVSKLDNLVLEARRRFTNHESFVGLFSFTHYPSFTGAAPTELPGGGFIFERI
jgi:hypothetical protein